MGTLRELPNIGVVAESLLIKAEVDTPEKLRMIGSKEAFIRIRLHDSTACLHMLYGIEGADRGIRDTELSPDVKQDLKAFFNTL